MALLGWPSDRGDLPTAAEVAEVELGLYVLQEFDPQARAVDLWPLLSGYPYAKAFNPVLAASTERALEIARRYLVGVSRRQQWIDRLQKYLRVEEEYRGYDLSGVDAVPARRMPTQAPDRFEVYARALQGLTSPHGKTLPMAGAGSYRFATGRIGHSVRISETLLSDKPTTLMPLRSGKSGDGAPIVVSRHDLLRAAQAMDVAEQGNPDAKPRKWEQSFSTVEMSVASLGGFIHDQDWSITVDGLFHMVGMVGAGKSTVMHLLTYHCVVELGLKVTLVVGDVAESLRTVGTFNNLQDERISAAPIVGRSTRERHVQRLHLRQHSSGASTMLAHSDPAFQYLSVACPIDALRGHEGATPLRILDAPCESLMPVKESTIASNGDPFLATTEDASFRKAQKDEPHGCPVWSRCPRHIAARELTEVPVWVATMPGLLHARLPRHQTNETIRYLEAAADRSDLIIIDEADRVQTQLDAAFAPAETLCGSGEESWIDWLVRHTSLESTSQGRRQLSSEDIARWNSALNVVHSAADRIYSMLNQDVKLREWVGTDYFSAMTLHQDLYRDWITEPDPDTGHAERDFFEKVLNDFRDKPVHPGDRSGDDGKLVAELVDLTNMLLNSAMDEKRLDDALKRLTSGASAKASNPAKNRSRFAVTMLVAALDNQLTVLTRQWPRVEAALNLESAANALTRRPPRDYEAVMAQSPMGNVLGFQFSPERPGPPPHSGSLRFFHCNGVGRDLLRRLPRLGLDDNVPGPHVVLMSGTSWAGTSTRYHLNTPVSAILRPPADNVAAIRETSFKDEFFVSSVTNEPIQVSGIGDRRQRQAALLELLTQLAVPDSALPGSKSPLMVELEDLSEERRRVLLLTGSYEEAKTAAEFLENTPLWRGRVTRLIPDDADHDDVWQHSLRRGELTDFANSDSQILIAPLLAVERGHNIVLSDGRAAIGTVYFLVRPHDRPDDIKLAIYAINDWATRYTEKNGPFFQLPSHFATMDAAADRFRYEARKNWRHFLTRSVAWSSLSDEEKDAFAWDQLVSMWQVIGRLVRGGVPARVRFCDAAFAPGSAAGKGVRDTPRTALLVRFKEILRPYFEHDITNADQVLVTDRYVAEALFQPFWDALINKNERD